MFACDAIESQCIMQQEFILSANFYTLLVDNRIPQNTILHRSKKKAPQNVLYCWLWWAADTEKACGIWDRVASGEGHFLGSGNQLILLFVVG